TDPTVVNPFDSSVAKPFVNIVHATIDGTVSGDIPFGATNSLVKAFADGVTVDADYVGSTTALEGECNIQFADNNAWNALFNVGGYTLSPTSAAIDKGNNEFVSDDLKADIVGTQRPYGENGYADLGAYESKYVQERPSIIVTTLDDVVDPNDGWISLREAVEVYFTYDIPFEEAETDAYGYYNGTYYRKFDKVVDPTGYTVTFDFTEFYKAYPDRAGETTITLNGYLTDTGATIVAGQEGTVVDAHGNYVNAGFVVADLTVIDGQTQKTVTKFVTAIDEDVDGNPADSYCDYTAKGDKFVDVTGASFDVYVEATPAEGALYRTVTTPAGTTENLYYAKKDATTGKLSFYHDADFHYATVDAVAYYSLTENSVESIYSYADGVSTPVDTQAKASVKDGVVGTALTAEEFQPVLMAAPITIDQTMTIDASMIKETTEETANLTYDDNTQKWVGGDQPVDVVLVGSDKPEDAEYLLANGPDDRQTIYFGRVEDVPTGEYDVTPAVYDIYTGATAHTEGGKLGPVTVGNVTPEEGMSVLEKADDVSISPLAANQTVEFLDGTTKVSASATGDYGAVTTTTSYEVASVEYFKIEEYYEIEKLQGGQVRYAVDQETGKYKVAATVRYNYVDGEWVWDDQSNAVPTEPNYDAYGNITSYGSTPRTDIGNVQNAARVTYDVTV
ncbi:MAG: hypothetical protein IK077_05590, partial [Thermoguttaceae bacterium]|nr:hypothetical protein [Thermoguttaceae bacterium]